MTSSLARLRHRIEPVALEWFGYAELRPLQLAAIEAWVLPLETIAEHDLLERS